MSQPKTQSKVNPPDCGRTLQIDMGELQRAPKPAGERRYVLICEQGTEIGRPIALGQGEMTVGRATNCELSLHDSRVSRQHAKIRWEGDHHLLEDLNSGNGTFVAGRRIAQHRLSVGDVIQFGAAFAYRYALMDEERKALMEQLYESSVTDPLTRAYNREHFNNQLNTEFALARGTPTGVCLLMLDIDHFKTINDTYGHAAGDAVLVELVKRILARLRPGDVLCRYGGEEFGVIMRGSDLATSVRMAERLRLAVRRNRFEHAEQSIAVTVSIGCASAKECDDATVDKFVALTDRRLYAAKHQGRDRVVATD